jgi:RHS repeat-associated protein
VVVRGNRSGRAVACSRRLSALRPRSPAHAEYGADNALNAQYVYGLERISLDRGGNVYYYLFDGQNSTRQLTDAAGGITDTWGYFAYGEQFLHTGTTVNSFTYTGEEWNKNAGLYFLRARWMDAKAGNFVSADPIAGDVVSPLTLNKYLYANANPVNYTDPSGTFGLAGVMGIVALLYTLNMPTVIYANVNEYCGKDVGNALVKTYINVRDRWYNPKQNEIWRKAKCRSKTIINLVVDEKLREIARSDWDMEYLAYSFTSDILGCKKGLLSRNEAVTVSGKCYYSWDVNYMLFGWINSFCGNSMGEMEFMIREYAKRYKPNDDVSKKIAWARQGYLLDFSAPGYTDDNFKKCKTCNEEFKGDLKSKWP